MSENKRCSYLAILNMSDEGDVASSAKGLKAKDAHMPLGKYGSSQQFASVDDKHGVLWQFK